MVHWNDNGTVHNPAPEDIVHNIDKYGMQNTEQCLHLHYYASARVREKDRIGRKIWTDKQ